MKKINYLGVASRLLDVVCTLVAVIAVIPIWVFMYYEYLQMFIFFIKYDIVFPDIVGTFAGIGFFCVAIVLYVGFIVVMQAFSRGLKEFYHHYLKGKIV